MIYEYFSSQEELQNEVISVEEVKPEEKAKNHRVQTRCIRLSR
jgi:hypothetical protein